MTEAEWAACEDPRRMVDRCPPHISERKLRLIGLAWYDHPRRLPAGQLDRLADVMARFADGHATAEEFDAARADALAAIPGGDVLWAPGVWAELLHLADHLARDGLRRYLDSPGANSFGYEGPARCDIVRDVIGPRPTPIQFPARCRTRHTLGVATALYADRAWDRLPVLADALEDAGCDDEAVLAHCRSPGRHVRGCWVVDLVLGKS